MVEISTSCEVSPDLASKSKPKPKDIRLEPMTYRREQNHIRIAANEFRRCYDGIKFRSEGEPKYAYRSTMSVRRRVKHTTVLRCIPIDLRSNRDLRCELITKLSS